VVREKICTHCQTTFTDTCCDTESTLHITSAIRMQNKHWPTHSVNYITHTRWHKNNFQSLVFLMC